MINDYPSELSPLDAQALDALISAGHDLSRVPAPLRPRASQITDLLALISAGPAPECSQTLVDVTLARVLRAGQPDDAAVLSPNDTEALDAYVSADFRASKVPASLRDRAERVEAMVQLVSQTRTVNVLSPSLVERTMRRVEAASPADRDDPIPIHRGGFRFADLISVAAVLMMGAAVLWPVLSTVRGYQQKSGCLANLGSIAT